MKTSFINSLRTSIANFINPVIEPEYKMTIPAGTKTLFPGTLPKHMAEQVAHTPVYRGQFNLSNLELIHSIYLKNAIAQYGAWSALAKAFNAFQKQYGRRSASTAPFEKLSEEFHAWNLITDVNKQMSDEDILLTVDRLAEVKPAKGSPATDKIIADIRAKTTKGYTVVQLKKDRMEKAQKATEIRKELISAFIAALSTPNGSDVDPEIPLEKVIGKATQTIEWLANQDWDPVYVSTECVLIQGDIDHLESLAKKEPETTHVNGILTADAFTAPVEARKFGDERPEQVGATKYPPKVSAEDTHAFLEWQAAQHNE